MTVPGIWISGRILSAETLLTSSTSAALPGSSSVPSFFMKLVVDAEVGHRAAERATGGAERHAEQRHEEDEADEAAPQRAARGAEAGHRRLVQLDLAVLLALDDHQVLELDHMGLDRLPEVPGDLLRGRDVLIGDGYEITHWYSSS